VSLHTLVMAHILRLAGRTAQSVSLLGDNPLVNPNTALHVGLALHELTTNASTHGALSRPGQGHVSIESRLVQSGGEPILTFEWSETTPSAPKPSPGPRFGTVVLERVVPQSVGGEARFSHDAAGVHYWLRIPKGRFAP
jgi:two-component sensor histidine kinase